MCVTGNMESKIVNLSKLQVFIQLPHTTTPLQPPLPLAQSRAVPPRVVELVTARRSSTI